MTGPVNKLVRQIREILASNGVNGPIESLAAEYARLSEEAAHRLDSCATMIAKGSEYQALQLAETEPALLDLLAALSFAETPEWAELCAAQRAPVASRFDPRAVQALDHLYGKGITANHPLYKDYRSAVTSRDDVKALQIVRSIVRLNPGDANGSAELARWENKFFQRRLQELRGALARGDESAVLNELGELERLAPSEKLAELPEAIQAMAIRRKDEREAAVELSERLVASLEEERRGGSWRMVGDSLARLDALQTEHHFKLPPAAAAICAGMKQYYEAERARASESERFRKAVAAAGAVADDVDARLSSPGSLTLRRTESLFLDLTRRWNEIEQFRRPVDDPVGARIGAAISGLRAQLRRLQFRQRVLQMAGGAVALLILGVAAWWAFSAYRARDYERQLTTLQSDGQVDAVEKMAAYLRTEQPGLAARPVLRARLDALEKWTQDERTNQREAETILAELEKMNAGGFDAENPTRVANELSTDARLIAALPAGLQTTPRSRLAVVRNQFQTYLEGSRDKLTAHNDEALSSLEMIAGTQLTYDEAKATIAGALEKIEPELKSLEALLHPPLKALELPEAQQARVAALRKRFDLFQGELSALKEISDALLQATTLEAYRDALDRFKQSHLAQVSEVNHARKLLAIFPKPDEMLGSLLIPEDPAGWAYAKRDTSGVAFAPDTVTPTEIAKLLALRENIYLNNIWEATLVDYTHKGDRHEVYSQGELKKDGPREVGDGLQTTSWSGAIFDPALKGESIVFAPVNLSSTRSTAGTSGTGEIDRNRLSAVSQGLAQIELNRMTDSTGVKYEKPLLGVFDGLVRERDVSPIFKGYMMQQLASIMSYRAYAWGAMYCPSLKDDVKKLNALCKGTALRGEDWLLERKRTEFLPLLTPFFHELESRNYLAEARANRDLIRAAVKAGIHYGGFIGDDLRARLLGEANAGVALWAVAASNGRLTRFRTPEGEGMADEKFARFSPVVFVPVDTETLEMAASRAAKSTPAGEAKSGGIPLFAP